MAECKELWNLRKRIQSQEFEVNFAKFNSISTWEETASYWRQELQSREKVVMELLLAEDRDDLEMFVSELGVKECKWLLKRLDVPDRTRFLSAMQPEKLQGLWKETSMMHQRSLWNCMETSTKKALLLTFTVEQWDFAMKEQRYIFNYIWNNAVVFKDDEVEQIMEVFPI